LEYDDQELRNAGGASLFSTITVAERIGKLGPGNVLRGDGIGNVDLSALEVYAAVCERHKLQFRADFFNLTNTRNYGIPEAAASPIPPGSSMKDHRRPVTEESSSA